MANLLFYDKPAALNKVAHKNVKLKPVGNNYGFARKTNSVILAGVEFTEAAKDYPIVFAKAGEQIVPVALLGLRNEENLYIDKTGKWDARYVPAFVRRYPFVLAETGEEGQRMVCIDESYAGFNESDGEALFAGDEPTPLLKQAIDFLEEYQRQYSRTEAFVKRLVDNDLLMALNARVDLVDGNQFALTGLLAVDEKKLLQMADAEALAFFRSGELAWLYCHLMSLGNMARMVDRIAGVATAPKTGTGDAKADKPVEKAAAEKPAEKPATKSTASATDKPRAKDAAAAARAAAEAAKAKK